MEVEYYINRYINRFVTITKFTFFENYFYINKSCNKSSNQDKLRHMQGEEFNLRRLNISRNMHPKNYASKEVILYQICLLRKGLQDDYISVIIDGAIVDENNINFVFFKWELLFFIAYCDSMLKRK